jgi:hypothetical protein
MGVHEIRWDSGVTEPGGECTFFMERGMRIMSLVYYELKRHKPWFDEGCLELLD